MSARRAGRSGPGVVGLLARIIGSTPGAGALVAATVLVGVLLGVAGPTLAGEVFTASIRSQVDTGTSVLQRDLTAQALGSPDPGPSAAGADTTTSSGFPAGVDRVWGAQNDALLALRAAMPETLRGVLGGPESFAVSDSVSADHPSGTLWPRTRIALAADPRVADRVRLVAGTAPAPVAPGDLYVAPIELMVSAAVAEDLGWAVGEVRNFSYPETGTQQFRLSGIFEPLDAAADTWQHTSLVLATSVDFSDGEPEYSAQAYVDPASWPVVSSLPVATRSQLWFPVETDALTASSASAVETEARAFTTQPREASTKARPLDDGSLEYRRNPAVHDVRFQTQLPDAIETARQRNDVTAGLLVTIVAGPAGVLLAVLVLIARLWAAARRSTFELVTARGASGLQLRIAGGAEGLLFALPAALAGWGVAAALLPGRLVGAGAVGPAGSATVVAVFALLPAVLFAVVAPGGGAGRGGIGSGGSGGTGGAGGADAAGGSPRGLRLGAELGVVALAAVSVVLLGLGRSPVASTGAPNPLESASALLVALAVCVVVLRVFPLLMSGLERVVRRQPGASSFVGVTSAGRSRAAGLAPLVAIVVGLSISLFSVSLVQTVDRGIGVQAQAETGADLTISSRTLTAPEVDAIAALPGVDAVAEVSTDQNATVFAGSAKVPMTILVVDSAAVRRVQQGLSVQSVLPPQATGAAEGDGTPIPLIASEAAAEALAGGELVIRGHPVTIVGTVPGDSPFTADQTWLLVDSSSAQPIIAAATTLTTALVSYGSGAEGGDDAGAGSGPSPAQVAAVRALADPYATVRVPTEIAERLRSDPATGAVTTALALTMVLSLVLSVVTVLITFTLGSGRRRSTLRLLSSLGLPRRRAWHLAAWEILPLSIVGVVAGALTGILLAVVILPSTDLRPFTGSPGQPALVLPPGLFAACAGASLLAALLTTAVGAVTSTRRPTPKEHP